MQNDPTDWTLLFVTLLLLVVAFISFAAGRQSSQESYKTCVDKLSEYQEKEICMNIMPFIKNNGYVFYNQDVKGCPLAIKKYSMNDTFGGYKSN